MLLSFCGPWIRLKAQRRRPYATRTGVQLLATGCGRVEVHAVMAARILPVLSRVLLRHVLLCYVVLY